MAKTPNNLNRLGLERLEDRCVPSVTGANWFGDALSKHSDLPEKSQVGHDINTPTPAGASTAHRLGALLDAVRAWAGTNDNPSPGIPPGENHGGVLGGAPVPITGCPSTIVNCSGPAYTGDVSGGTTDQGDPSVGKTGWDQPYYM
jgi:hypothetical protein